MVPCRIDCGRSVDMRGQQEVPENVRRISRCIQTESKALFYSSSSPLHIESLQGPKNEQQMGTLHDLLHGNAWACTVCDGFNMGGPGLIMLSQIIEKKLGCLVRCILMIFLK